jgi:hypothetical protein
MEGGGMEQQCLLQGIRTRERTRETTEGDGNLPDRVWFIFKDDRNFFNFNMDIFAF